MKFLLISNMYPTKKNPGYGSFVKNVCEGLDKLGIKMVAKAVIKGREKNRFLKILNYLCFYFSIIYSFFFKKYDFIYIHFPNQAIPILRHLYKIKTPQIIINYHGEDLLYRNTEYATRLGRMTEEFCRRYATGCIVPSEYYKAVLLKKRLIEKNRIIVSPSGGIAPEIFFPKQTHLKHKLNIGYVGRLENGKGYKEFLEVCLQLKNQGMDFQASMIGYGSKSGWVTKYIENEGLIDYVTLINGVVQTEIGKIYRNFDLLIFCSSRESLGLVGIEAMACGVPVIGTDIPGIKTYLKDGVNGWIVPLYDIVQEVVKKIISYEEMREDVKATITQNCINTAKDYLTPQVCKNLSQDIKVLLN